MRLCEVSARQPLCRLNLGPFSEAKDRVQCFKRSPQENLHFRSRVLDYRLVFESTRGKGSNGNLSEFLLNSRASRQAEIEKEVEGVYNL